jgi:hypothetical protein
VRLGSPKLIYYWDKFRWRPKLDRNSKNKPFLQHGMTIMSVGLEILINDQTTFALMCLASASGFQKMNSYRTMIGRAGAYLLDIAQSKEIRPRII